MRLPWRNSTWAQAAEENEERWYTASQWTLIWRRFRKHKVAMIGLTFLALAYIVALIPGFFAPYDPLERNSTRLYAPPQNLHIYDSESGSFGLFVYGIEMGRDPETLQPVYTVDKEQRHPIKFFVKGENYEILGTFKTNIHLFGTTEGESVNLIGTDHLGRDMLSRVIHGANISLFIGLVGVAFSFVIGSFLGGISGYYGGFIDNIVQRLIEFVTSIPTIPLWMSLAVALPEDWSQLQVYFAITIILSLRGWAGLARVVRGQLLDLRNEDYVMAARLLGQPERAIIFWHLLPATFSYLVVSITLAIPSMILGETALSFLGLGLRPPTISWGVLLQNAQNIRTIALYPWLLYPAFAVILVVLCFNFVGDGLRDAADPYAS